ncbi:MAG TPA: hypothetical protein VF444_16750 [Pseudonocardiaceae bacterium]
MQIGDLAAAAPKFTEVGNELARAVSAQSDILQGLGSFWGTVKPGPDFGQQYQPLMAKALELAQACGIAVQGVGQGLERMGKDYAATESTIAGSFQAGS